MTLYQLCKQQLEIMQQNKATIFEMNSQILLWKEEIYSLYLINKLFILVEGYENDSL